jgi:2-dehydro-3-deoxy-D-pentonate aldolase
MSHPSLHGLVPPLLTPFTPDRRLDVDALHRVVEWLLTGVHGLFLLGTTAEFTQLDDDLSLDILKHSAEINADRVPLAVHVTHTNRRRAQHLIYQAADIGAAAVVVTAPYYFRPSQDELFDYVMDVVGMSPLPVVLYNMPHYTKVSFGIPLLRRLMQESRIVGMKDSSGSIGFLADLTELARGRPDFHVLVGSDYLFTDCIRLGGHGAVIGSPYLAPPLCRDLYEALRAGDLQRAEPLQRKLNAVTSRIFFSQANDDLGVIKSIKTCLAVKGLCTPTMSWPHQPLSADAERHLSETMRELNLL